MRDSFKDLTHEQVMALITWEQTSRYANALNHGGVLPLFDFSRPVDGHLHYEGNILSFRSSALYNFTLSEIEQLKELAESGEEESGEEESGEEESITLDESLRVRIQSLNPECKEELFTSNEINFLSSWLMANGKRELSAKLLRSFKITSELPVSKLFQRDKLTESQRRSLFMDELAIQSQFDRCMITDGKLCRKEGDDWAGFWHVAETKANIQLIKVKYPDLFEEDSLKEGVVKFAQTQDKDVNGALPIRVSNFGAVGEDRVQHACDVIIVKDGQVALGQRLDQTDLFALFGGLSEDKAAVRASGVVFEVFDEAIGSGLMGSKFYTALINAIPKEDEDLVRLLNGIDMGVYGLTHAAVKAKLDSIDEGSDQKTRTAKAKFIREIIKLAETLHKTEDANYQTLEELLTDALKPVKNSRGEHLSVVNDSEHRTTLSAVAESKVYYVNLDDANLKAEFERRGIVLQAGDDITNVKFADMKELFKHGWGEHGGILWRTILTLDAKSDRLQGEQDIARAGMQQLEEFKDDDDGLRATVERLAKNLLDMIVSNSEYDKKRARTGMFASRFNALEYINSSRGAGQNDAVTLYHILDGGSFVPGKPSFARSHDLVNAVMPLRIQEETKMNGVKLLQHTLACHPMVNQDQVSFSTCPSYR